MQNTYAVTHHSHNNFSHLVKLVVSLAIYRSSPAIPTGIIKMARNYMLWSPNHALLAVTAFWVVWWPESNPLISTFVTN